MPAQAAGITTVIFLTIQVCTREAIEIGSPIGSGKNGSVYLARHIESGALYAAKTFDWDKVASDLSRIYRELDIQSNMQHPNILTLIGCIVDQE